MARASARAFVFQGGSVALFDQRRIYVNLSAGRSDSQGEDLAN